MPSMNPYGTQAKVLNAPLTFVEAAHLVGIFDALRTRGEFTDVRSFVLVYLEGDATAAVDIKMHAGGTFRINNERGFVRVLEGPDKGRTIEDTARMGFLEIIEESPTLKRGNQRKLQIPQELLGRG